MAACRVPLFSAVSSDRNQVVAKIEPRILFNITRRFHDGHFAAVVFARFSPPEPFPANTRGHSLGFEPANRWSRSEMAEIPAEEWPCPGNPLEHLRISTVGWPELWDCYVFEGGDSSCSIMSRTARLAGAKRDHPSGNGWPLLVVGNPTSWKTRLVVLRACLSTGLPFSTMRVAV